MSDTAERLLREKLESLQDDGSEGYPFSQEEIDLMITALSTIEHNESAASREEICPTCLTASERESKCPDDWHKNPAVAAPIAESLPERKDRP